MAINQNGIAISLKAFVPMGKSIDEQLEVLMLVKSCHASGDYSPLLKMAIVDQVKAEQKTRRIEDPAEQVQGEATEATAADVPAEADVKPNDEDTARPDRESGLEFPTDDASADDGFWNEPQEAEPEPEPIKAKGRRR